MWNASLLACLWMVATDPAAHVPRGIHDDGPVPRAFAVLDGSTLWVCWDRERPACFRPVELPAGEVPLEMAFTDRSTLVLAVSADSFLQVVAEDLVAVPVEAHDALLLSPRPLRCTAAGVAPRLGLRQPRWVACTPDAACPGRLPALPRPRRATGLDLRLSVAVTHARREDSGLGPWAPRSVAGGFTAVVGLRMGLSLVQRTRDRMLLDTTRLALARSPRCLPEAS